MSTNLRKTSRFTAVVVCLVVVGLFVAYGCEKEEDYDAITYYNAVGIGHVFECDANGNVLLPIQDTEITVTTGLEGTQGLFGTASTFKETYTTDVNGKYQVRFIKRTKRRDATLYTITLNSLGTGHPYQIWNNWAQFYPKEVISAPNNIVIIDTIKIAYH